MDTLKSDTKSNPNIPTSFPTLRVAAAGIIVLASIIFEIVYYPDLIVQSFGVPIIYTIIGIGGSVFAVRARRQQDNSNTKAAVIILAVLAIAGISQLFFSAVPDIIASYIFDSSLGGAPALTAMVGGIFLSAIYMILSLVSAVLISFITAGLLFPVYRYILQEKLLNILLVGVFALLLVVFDPVYRIILLF